MTAITASSSTTESPVFRMDLDTTKRVVYVLNEEGYEVHPASEIPKPGQGRKITLAGTVSSFATPATFGGRVKAAVGRHTTTRVDFHSETLLQPGHRFDPSRVRFVPEFRGAPGSISHCEIGLSGSVLVHTTIPETSRPKIEGLTATEGEKIGPLFETPVDEEECAALTKILSEYPEIWSGLSTKDLSEMITTMIPRMIQVKNYLKTKFDAHSGEKPDQMKVSGKMSPYLSFISKTSGIQFNMSVTILSNGGVVYSIPKTKPIEGGIKKVTFKVLSHIDYPKELMNSAKALPRKTTGIRSDATRLADVRRGIRIAEELAHPNVVTPAGVIERRASTLSGDELLPIILMPVMTSLPDTVKTLIPSRMEDIKKETAHLGVILFSLFEDTVRGSAHIDSKGYVHNDIKPANILVQREMTEDGPKYTARVNDLDFVCTKAEAARGDFARAGTLGYFIPGKIRSEQSDIYALGMTIYQVGIPFLNQLLAKIPSGAEYDEIRTALEATKTDLTSMATEMTSLTQTPIRRIGVKIIFNYEYNNSSSTYPLILAQLASIKARLEAIRGPMPTGRRSPRTPDPTTPTSAGATTTPDPTTVSPAVGASPEPTPAAAGAGVETPHPDEAIFVALPPARYSSTDSV